jgi:hypothetical protein
MDMALFTLSGCGVIAVVYLAICHVIARIARDLDDHDID